VEFRIPVESVPADMDSIGGVFSRRGNGGGLDQKDDDKMRIRQCKPTRIPLAV